MPIDLAGRRILVVGASSGIGASTARLAAGRGARVAVTARRADRLAQLTATLPDALAVAGDVRDEADVRRIVDSTVEAFAGLDAVVYAAAVSPLIPMARATKADWRDVLDTNLVGAALISAAAAPHLIESSGRLVILSSKSVRQPFADLSLYTTSKIALDGLIRCLPVEFPGLLVTRVVVGNTHSTDFASTWDQGALSAALGRWSASGVLGATDAMHPDDVAAVVLHALSSSAHVDDIAVIDTEAGRGSPTRDSA